MRSHKPILFCILDLKIFSCVEAINLSRHAYCLIPFFPPFGQKKPKQPKHDRTCVLDYIYPWFGPLLTSEAVWRPLWPQNLPFDLLRTFIWSLEVLLPSLKEWKFWCSWGHRVVSVQSNPSFASLSTLCPFLTVSKGSSIGTTVASDSSTSLGRKLTLKPRKLPCTDFWSGGCHAMYSDVLDVLCAAVTRGFPDGSATSAGRHSQLYMLLSKFYV